MPKGHASVASTEGSIRRGARLSLALGVAGVRFYNEMTGNVQPAALRAHA